MTIGVVVIWIMWFAMVFFAGWCFYWYVLDPLRCKGWQPISTAPKDGTRFIGLRDSGYIEVEIVYRAAYWVIRPEEVNGPFYAYEWQTLTERSGFMTSRATHWMPLPKTKEWAAKYVEGDRPPDPGMDGVDLNSFTIQMKQELEGYTRLFVAQHGFPSANTMNIEEQMAKGHAGVINSYEAAARLVQKIWSEK